MGGDDCRVWIPGRCCPGRWRDGAGDLVAVGALPWPDAGQHGTAAGRRDGGRSGAGAAGEGCAGAAWGVALAQLADYHACWGDVAWVVCANWLDRASIFVAGTGVWRAIGWVRGGACDSVCHCRAYGAGVAAGGWRDERGVAASWDRVIRAGVGAATSLPPLIAQQDFAPEQTVRAVALVTACSQACYAFAPAAFGALRDLAPNASIGSYLFVAAALVQLSAAGVVLL